MQRIYQSKDNKHAVFTQLSNGSWIRFQNFKQIESALLDKLISGYCYENEQEILDSGWLPFDHDNLEWLLSGDLVKHKDGNYCRVLARDGIGELTVYKLSYQHNDINHDNIKRFGMHYTAYELKASDYTRYAPETSDPELDKAKALLEDRGFKVERV